MPIGALPLALLLAASGLSRVRAHGEIRWGGDLQGGEPYVFRDPRDPDKLVGFEVDLVRALAAKLGVRERFFQNDWSNLVPSLERGDFDIIVNGLEDTPALRGRILLSRPYFDFTEQLVVRRGSKLRTLDALRGHRVGTLASSLAHQILRSKRAIEVVLYGGQEEPYRDLQLERTDAVLLDSVIAQRYGLTKPDLELADADVARGSYVIGLRKGDSDLRDALNAALAKLDADGELRRIYTRWHLPEVPNTTPSIQVTTPPQATFDRAQVMLFLVDAAATLGLSRWQSLRLVLLPQALRTALPAMTNDLIALLKDSSLVSVITVVELTKQMTITAVDVRSWALPGALCATLYFAMSYPLARLAARLEARLEAAGEEPVVAPAT